MKSMRYLFIHILSILVLGCSSPSERNVEKQKADSLSRATAREDSIQRKQKEEAGRFAVIADRNSVLTFVTTNKPTFNPVIFGGFKNIRFMLFNDYQYPLDEVILKVHYIRNNGKTIKTERMVVTQMPPASRKELKAPDYTAAGTKLKITVESVLCRAIDLCYENGLEKGGSDPYRCR